MDVMGANVSQADIWIFWYYLQKDKKSQDTKSLTEIEKAEGSRFFLYFFFFSLERGMEKNERSKEEWESKRQIDSKD